MNIDDLPDGLKSMFELRNQGFCPFCKKKPNIADFRNPISVKEYAQSGICQPCQDDFFGRD